MPIVPHPNPKADFWVVADEADGTTLYASMRKGPEFFLGVQVADPERGCQWVADAALATCFRSPEDAAAAVRRRGLAERLLEVRTEPEPAPVPGP